MTMGDGVAFLFGELLTKLILAENQRDAALGRVAELEKELADLRIEQSDDEYTARLNAEADWDRGGDS